MARRSNNQTAFSLDTPFPSVPATEETVVNTIEQPSLLSSELSTQEPIVAPADTVNRRDATIQEVSMPVIERISIPLKADGTFDLDKVRVATKDKLKKAVDDPLLRPNLGLGGSDEFGLPPEFFKSAYDMLGQLEAVLFEKTLKIDRDLAQEIFKYTDAECTLLAKPTARVVNKRLPTKWLKNKDEIALAMLLLGMHNRKIMNAKYLMNKRRAQKNECANPGQTQTGKVNTSPETGNTEA
jgi:hypothetical protein